MATMNITPGGLMPPRRRGNLFQRASMSRGWDGRSISPETNAMADAAERRGMEQFDNSSAGRRIMRDIGMARQNKENLMYGHGGSGTAELAGPVSPREAAARRMMERSVSQPNSAAGPVMVAPPSMMGGAMNPSGPTAQAARVAEGLAMRAAPDSEQWKNRERYDTWSGLNEKTRESIQASDSKRAFNPLPADVRSQLVMSRAMGIPLEQLQNRMVTNKAMDTNTLEGDMLAGSLTGGLNPLVGASYQNRRGMAEAEGMRGAAAREIAAGANANQTQLQRMAADDAMKQLRQEGTQRINEMMMQGANAKEIADEQRKFDEKMKILESQSSADLEMLRGDTARDQAMYESLGNVIGANGDPQGFLDVVKRLVPGGGGDAIPGGLPQKNPTQMDAAYEKIRAVADPETKRLFDEAHKKNLAGGSVSATNPLLDRLLKSGAISERDRAFYEMMVEPEFDRGFFGGQNRYGLEEERRAYPLAWDRTRPMFPGKYRDAANRARRMALGLK